MSASHRSTSLLGSLVRGAFFFGDVPGVVICLLAFGVAPTLAVSIVGTVFADLRGATPQATGIGASTAALLLMMSMVVGVWAARARSLPVALVGSALYMAAGLGLLAVEAYSGASSSMGWWPTNKEGDAAMRFALHLWAGPAGWLLLLGAASVPFVFAMALRGRSARSGTAKALTAGPNSPKGESEGVGRRSMAAKPTLKLDDLAGMVELKAQLREFAVPFARYHRADGPVADTNGLLLSGPPGNGKTVFAEALAGELGFSFISLSVQDLTSKWVNESPARIQEAFQDAVGSQPCVLFLDEFDAIGKPRSRDGQSAHGEDVKVTATLLTEINKLKGRRVVLVAATNYPDDLDQALVRQGRFDRKIEVPMPDFEARVGVLRAFLRKYGVSVPEDSVKAAAALWERRSVAFIESVAKRVRDDLAKTGVREVDVAGLKGAARAISRREGAIPKVGAKLSDLVLPNALRRDAASIVYRLKNWEALAERGATPPKGVLLIGPPGTGKTNLVRAMARELGDWHVFEVKTADVLADPRRFQDVLNLASEHRPALVFIDEADDLLNDRTYSANSTATNEVLKAMDGLMGAIPEVVFMAATNNADAIDAAAKRGGRFGEKLLVDLLRGSDLLAFASAELSRRRPVRFADDLVPSWIAAAVGEIGPADLIAVIDRSINATVIDDMPRPITRADFSEAFMAITGRLLPDA